MMVRSPPAIRARRIYSNALNANMSFQLAVPPWTPVGGASLALSTPYAFASAGSATTSLQVTPGSGGSGDSPFSATPGAAFPGAMPPAYPGTATTGSSNPGAASELVSITTTAGRIASQQASSVVFATSGIVDGPGGDHVGRCRMLGRRRRRWRRGRDRELRRRWRRWRGVRAGHDRGDRR